MAKRASKNHIYRHEVLDKINTNNHSEKQIGLDHVRQNKFTGVIWEKLYASDDPNVTYKRIQ